MTPRHIPVVVVLEGDYSKWTLKWESDALTVVYNSFAHGSEFTNNETEAIIVDAHDNMVIVNVADGSLGTEHANWGYGFVSNQLADTSVLGRYMATCNHDFTAMRIFKDGVLQHTINIDDTNDEIDGCVMSPSGKYIIFCYWDNSGGDYRLRCYEGS